LRVWRRGGPRRWLASGIALAWMALVPAAVSLPFVVWNAEGFVRSILFSATRAPEIHLPGFYSLDPLIGMTIPRYNGLPARLPLLLMMTLVWWAALRREAGPCLARLLPFLVSRFQLSDVHAVLRVASRVAATGGIRATGAREGEVRH